MIGPCVNLPHACSAVTEGSMQKLDSGLDWTLDWTLDSMYFSTRGLAIIKKAPHVQVPVC